MNENNELGAYLRSCREAHGLSTRGLAARTELEQATIVRIENGVIRRPRPDILAKLAEALDLDSGDVFARADYTAPSSLPSLAPYLRTKYRDLPAADIEKIHLFAEQLAEKHGINLAGPQPGEDETVLTTSETLKQQSHYIDTKRHQKGGHHDNQG